MATHADRVRFRHPTIMLLQQTPRAFCTTGGSLQNTPPHPRRDTLPPAPLPWGSSSPLRGVATRSLGLDGRRRPVLIAPKRGRNSNTPLTTWDPIDSVPGTTGWVSGRVETDQEGALDLGVVVGGRVAGTTTVYGTQEGDHRFFALGDPALWPEGATPASGASPTTPAGTRSRNAEWSDARDASQRSERLAEPARSAEPAFVRAAREPGCDDPLCRSRRVAVGWSAVPGPRGPSDIPRRF